jgi:hypothetical protein
MGSFISRTLISSLFMMPLVPFDAHFEQLLGHHYCERFGEELATKFEKYSFRI